MSDRIGGLGGVLIWTSSSRYPAMESFYVDVLGLEPRSRRPGFVNFDWDGTRLTLAVHSEVAGPARDALRIMINLLVDDIDAVAARLASAGVRSRRAPEREEWGGWVCTFEDPDGNLLQLLQLQ